jgi:catechol 2,3-dioxygenase-like lactoylglutathione lyase family enzyme
MSRIIGPVRQVGHVVRDVDRAMAYWTEILGIGPFYVFRETRMTNFHYRGHRSTDLVVTLAFAQSGDVQIELIQQHNDAPSAYREFLSAGREGVQHLSPWFDDPAQYDCARARLIAQGLQLVHETRHDDGSPRFVYFETGTPDAPLIELSEALIPAVRIVPDTVAAASIDWDGRDPIRAFEWG